MGAREDPTFEDTYEIRKGEWFKNRPCKKGLKTYNLKTNLVRNGFRKFNLEHGDLDMAPNFNADPLVIVPDPKNLIFNPQMSKMDRNQKSENLGGRRHGRSPLIGEVNS